MTQELGMHVLAESSKKLSGIINNYFTTLKHVLPPAAGHSTLRDLRGTLIMLLAVPPLLGAGGNPARTLRRPPVERCGVTGTDP